jgi:hypothetical protein
MRKVLAALLFAVAGALILLSYAALVLTWMAMARPRGIALVTTILVVAILSGGAADADSGIDDRNDGRKICPKGSGAAGYDADRLEGRRMKRARLIAREHDCIVRVVKRDGEWLPITLELRPDRINVVVEHGRIRRVTSIG